MAAAKTVSLANGNNNILMTDNKKTMLLGADIVKVGVNTGEKTIVTNQDTGLKEVGNKIVAETVYTHTYTGPYFLLDLETGKRGWYPGCKVYGMVQGTDIDIRADESTSSESLGKVSQAEVQILSVLDATNSFSWFYIQYGEIKGYIQVNLISNIRYIDP